MANASYRERFPDLIKAKLRASAVLKDGVVFNNDFEGDPKAGAVQIPVRDTEVVVGTYAKTTGLAIDTSSGATTYEQMIIDKDVAVNEIIDGYDAASVPANLIADRLDSAGYSLAAKLDFEGAAVLLAGSTKNYSIEALSAANIYNYIVDLRTAMSKAGVPDDGKRYLLVDSDTYALMLKDTTNFIRQGDISQEIKATGAIGKYAGFNVYEFNLTGSNASSYAEYAALAGHPKFATRCNEFKIPPFIADLNGDSVYVGASAVKARMVFAHKALRATALQFLGTITPLTLAFAAGTTGTTTCTVTGAVSGTSTYRYRVNPAVNAIYGQTAVNGTNGFVTFTSAGANGVTVAAGAVLEVVQVLTSTGLVVARGEHTMLAAEVGS